LVKYLQAPLARADVAYEILLADDASDNEDMREANLQLCRTQPACRLYQLSENRGPAFVRNYLAAQARYPYLLFLDSDTIPETDDFITTYLSCRNQGVVCGGFRYLPLPPNRLKQLGMSILRYKYGARVESQPAAVRNRQPYARFISMNFLVARETMLRIPFDETLHFGYEDTAFGKQLEQAGVPIRHIDNPVWHLAIEDTPHFLAKTRREVENLRGHEAELRTHIRLLRYYHLLKRCHAVGLTAWVFRHTARRVERNLLSDHPSLLLFAFYKLGTLSTF
jgi:cellulose synthase/poly-beta-1,6-N-acetylglucosamine synthase-like glycosyltransferase